MQTWEPLAEFRVIGVGNGRFAKSARCAALWAPLGRANFVLVFHDRR
jgi:hypothetical protein